MTRRPRAVNVIGSMGSGKSTFMAQLLDGIGAELGPLEELEEGFNSRGSRLRLRGHRDGGLVYLGKMRDVHPGQDGLDRATTILVDPWLRRDESVTQIVTEGRLFLGGNCMDALAEMTDMLLVHLHAEEWLLELRFLDRGTNQTWGAVKTTATLAARWAAWAPDHGVQVVSADTGSPDQWNRALEAAIDHLTI